MQFHCSDTQKQTMASVVTAVNAMRSTRYGKVHIYEGSHLLIPCTIRSSTTKRVPECDTFVFKVSCDSIIILAQDRHGASVVMSPLEHLRIAPHMQHILESMYVDLRMTMDWDPQEEAIVKSCIMTVPTKQYHEYFEDS